MSTFRRGASAAMVAGAAGLGLCLQTMPAMAAPTSHTTAHQHAVKKPVTRKPVTKKPVARKPVARKPVAKKPVTKKPVAKKPVTRVVTHKPVGPVQAAQLNQAQASRLVLDILGDNLRSDAVVLKRVAGDHSAMIGTNDASSQTDASVKATWVQKGTASRSCTDEDACTVSRLAGGTLHTYDLLGTGYSYTYLPNGGGVVNLDDLDGQLNHEPTDYHPVDETRVATLLQDKRWARVLDASSEPGTTPARPAPPVTGTEVPSVLAQRIVTSYLAPEAKVASSTQTATSVTLATDGGVETGSWVKAEWMTRGSGTGQYDPQRDCYARFPEWNPLDHEDAFGTGTLCAQTMPGDENGPQHDWYYTRSDGRVLHISTMMGAYKGNYSTWTPVDDATVLKMLVDSRWDVVVRKLA